MKGIRTSGDLVARMQMSRGMKVGDAKRYVADRLGVSVSELTDEVLMREIREDLKIGTIRPLRGSPKGSEAKYHIARLLDIEINSSKPLTERMRVE